SWAGRRAARGRVLAQLPGQPGPGVTPIPLDGAHRRADHAGGFFHTQAREVAELDDLGQARVFRLEPPERLVQGEQVVGRRLDPGQPLAQLDALRLTAVLLTGLAAGLVHYDLAPRPPRPPPDM